MLLVFSKHSVLLFFFFFADAQSLLLRFRERRLQHAEEPLSHTGRKSAGSQTNMAYRHIEKHLSHYNQEATLRRAGGGGVRPAR